MRVWKYKYVEAAAAPCGEHDKYVEWKMLKVSKCIMVDKVGAR